MDSDSNLKQPRNRPSFDHSARAAIDNIVAFGDTDIFPFPLEHHIFFDQRESVLALLKDINASFDNYLIDRQPPVNLNSLSPVGYTGFRWATQLDPVWNAYVLSLVISIGQDIERKRILPQKQTVFSYRFIGPTDDHSIFDKSVGWPEFQARSLELSSQFEYVVVCDISDFYSRVYHHRLENALKESTDNTTAVRNIMKFLQVFAKTNSYGLPIGGPAARLLAELLLNRVDHLLVANGVTFCRFADDYHLFAQSREDAYDVLILLTEKLLENEGLSLQKAKTRILRRTEFVASAGLRDQGEADDSLASERQRFLTLKLRYDPYSQTASEDFQHLRDEVAKFDIVGMLGREVLKSRVHEALTRRLIKAIRYLDVAVRDDAIRSLIDNVDVLFPLFPQIMQLAKELFGELDEALRNYICQFLREQLTKKSPVMRVDLNVSYAIRVLALQPSDENEALLADLFSSSKSHLVRSDIILAMARSKALYWISDLKNNYSMLEGRERRAFIVTSYALGDEGGHWRDHWKKSFRPIEELFRAWAETKAKGRALSIPL